MSADAKLSVPVKLLFEGINHTVTVEMKNGESYRGELISAEECMNLQMTQVVHTARNGQKKKLEHIFLRGGNIKFIVFPSLLKDASIFRKVASMKKKHDQKSSSRRGRGHARKS